MTVPTSPEGEVYAPRWKCGECGLILHDGSVEVANLQPTAAADYRVGPCPECLGAPGLTMAARRRASKRHFRRVLP